MKVSGVKQKNQANVVKYYAYQNSPEYFVKLNSKFKDLLADKEDGVKQIIKYLEVKFGVNQQSEIVRKLNDFYSCSQKKYKDLVKYVSRFEQTYKECTEIKVPEKQNLVTYSSTALAVLLLWSCNLNDTDHQIISRSLNFDEDTVDEEKETFDKTKAVVIAHEVTKRANQATDLKNLATFLAKDL